MGRHSEDIEPDSIPEYLRRWPGLYVRQGNRIVEAPVEDAELAKSYPRWPDKGTLVDGRRLTIMSSSLSYRIGEEVRIIHVVEVSVEGQEVYIMGPKEVYGEYLDGKLVSAPNPGWDDPLQPPFYDGATLPSPAVDYGYDVTSYTFSTLGTHTVKWCLGKLCSNVLRLKVTG